MIAICAIATFLCLTNARAQSEKKIDSNILSSLENIPNDTAKIDFLLKLAAGQKKNIAVEGLYTKALNVSEATKSISSKIRVLNAFGVYKRDLSDYPEALDLHKKALSLARKTEDLKGEIISLNNIGVVYRRLDENSIALNYHMEALKLAEKSGDKFSESVSLNSIGNIHIVLGNYKDAIVYFTRCLPIAKLAGNNLGIAMNLNNIGEAYEYLNELDAARIYYDSSLVYNQKIDNKKGIAICYNSIGSVLKKQGRVTEAIDLLRKAVIINAELGDKIYLANSYNNLGDAYLKIGNYKNAEIMFSDAEVIAKSIGSRIETKNAYEGLMKVNEGLGNYSNALLYSKLSKTEGDSIVIESNNRHVRQMEAIYEKENERNRFALLEAKQKSNSIIILASIILIGLLLISVVLYFLRRRLLEKNMQLQRELEIRSQIARDLHDDMGSTLSSISIFSELLKHQPHAASSDDLITKIEANARDTMDALDDIIWLVKPGNDKLFNLNLHIQDYAVPLFENKNIRFNIDFPESISEMPLSMQTRRNIFLIIKESVNNLVKYSYATEASITAKNSEHELLFIVKDNGKGFDTNKETTRNGLKNMKLRAEQIKGEFKVNSVLGQGTETILKIPI